MNDNVLLYMMPEYRLIRPEIKFPLTVGIYRFDISCNMGNDEFYIPTFPEWCFDNGTEYRRAGNVTLTSLHPLHDINLNGTLYVSKEGAWTLISSIGMGCAGGSPGSFPIELDNTVINIVPERKKSRFEGIYDD